MKPLTVAAVLLGLALLVLAWVYVTTPANALPALVPGYDAASAVKHEKHAIASALLGAGALVLAWFSLGPRSAKA